MNDNPINTSPLKKPILEGKHPAIQLLYIVMLVIGCGIIISILGLLIAYGIWGQEVEQPNTHYYRFIQVFNAIGIFLVPALLFSYLQQNRWFTYNSANRKPGGAATVMCVGAAALCVLPVAGVLVELTKSIQWPDFMAGVEEWMQEKQDASDRVLEMLTADTHISTLVLNLLVCALVPAVCEEFFFRGSIQQFIHRWCKNAHVAVWTTGFIFSAFHLQIDGFIARWLLGAYLGYLLVWSGSLWLPILAHFLHNALSLLIQHIALSHNINTEPTLTTSTVLYALVALFFLILFIYLIYKTSHKSTSISTPSV